jgi:hypothetical protein
MVFFLPAVELAACELELIGRVAEIKGNWLDQRHPGRISIGSEVCSDSRLIRNGRRSDEDMLSVRPVKTGADLVVYRCMEGVTCNGPLNLTRLPVALANNRTVDDFLTFIKRTIGDRDEDLRNLRNFIHRGRVDVAEGVLLSTQGRIVAASLITEPSPTMGPIWFEFCRVRPGALCPNPAKPVLWDGKAETVPVEPGFYKLVVDREYVGGFQRTDTQSYILVIDGKTSYDFLLATYARAIEQASISANEEIARRDLITYLYYLGGGYKQ